MGQFVQVVDNVLSPSLCDEIINIFEKSPHRTPGITSGGIDTDKKVSVDVSLTRHAEFASVQARVSEAATKHIFDYFRQHFMAIIGTVGLTVRDPKSGQPVKLDVNNFAEVAEPNIANYVQHLFHLGDINVQKYDKSVGGYPYWHSEVYPQLGNNDSLHRMLFFMFYLNDVTEGGSTDFYYLDKSVQPVKGRMVIAPAYFTHTHRGAVPESSDKYILTSWVLFNRAEHIYSQ